MPFLPAVLLALLAFAISTKAFNKFSRISSRRWSSNSDSALNGQNEWIDLDNWLRELEPPVERISFNERITGRGQANSKASIRLFGAPEDYQPEVTLYRDASAWCPYCQRVWLYLEEKQLPYKIQTVPMSCYGDKPPSFLELSPSGNIPVVIIKGRVVTESKDIIFALEAEFPEVKPLLPAGLDNRDRVTALLALERRTFNAWLLWLNCVAHVPFQQDMHDRLAEVDAQLALAGGPYFLGAELSLVDCVFAPFLERMAASLPYYKGFLVRDERYPHLLKWYEAMDGRPAYRGIKSDYYTHCHDLPPQVGKCYAAAAAAPYAAEIDGGAWSLTAAGAASLEPMLPADSAEARRDAARQCIANHAKVGGEVCVHVCVYVCVSECVYMHVRHSPC